MSAYTATFFDNLTDGVLKSLGLMSLLMASPGTEHLTKAGRELIGLDEYQLQEFFGEVNAAIERRYGPVPGL